MNGAPKPKMPKGIFTWPRAWIALVCLVGVSMAFFRLSPVAALASGIALSLVFGNPARLLTSNFSKYSLQLAVVLLGFGMNLGLLLEVGMQTLGLTAIGIGATLLAGAMLGRALGLDKSLSSLIAVGTAICGGSAIAAVAPAIRATPVMIAVSMAVVFILNGLGLVIFPLIGDALQMNEADFGLWAALAIHDTISVIGAASIFGAQALLVGTTVKLTRALWIFPVTLIFARLHDGKGKAPIPWFLGGFLLAAALSSLFPENAVLWQGLKAGGRGVMVFSLFFVGLALTRDHLREIDLKPLTFGLILWICVASATLGLIQMGWIGVDL